MNPSHGIERVAAFRGIFGSLALLCLLLVGAAHAAVNTLSVAVDPQSPEILYAATDAGALKSTNGGSSWVSAGLTGIHLLGIAIDPQAPGTLFAWSYDTTGLYKSINGGGSWQAVPDLDSSYIAAFAIDPSVPNTLYVGTAGGISKSTDGGATWRLIGLSDVRSLAIDPISPNRVYAGTAAWGLFVSTDHGEMWTGLPDANLIINGPTISTIAIDPATPAVMYLGSNTADWCCIDGTAGFEYAQGGAIFKSMDAGITWQPTSMGPGWFSRVQAIAVDLRSGAVYVVRDSELYRSTDGMETWPAIPPLPGVPWSVGGVTLDAGGDPTIIYAATISGVLKSTDGGITWPAQFTLSLSTVGSGTITANPQPVSGTYTAGTVVNLSATPAANFQFAGWSGACSGSGACSVTMDAGKSVTATFAVKQFVLTLGTVGSGTITASPPPVSGTYAAGTVVSLTATPAAGSQFSGWSGACTGTSTCNVTMNAARSVTATFAVLPPPPPADTTAPETSITAVVDGTGTAIGDGAVTSSTSLTLSFAGTDNVGLARFECRLDGAGFSTCASPLAYYDLTLGRHTFEVRAVDTSNNVDATTARLPGT